MGDFYKPRESEEGKTIAITAELEEDDNRFTEDRYDITEFSMSISPNAIMFVCMNDPCEYDIEDRELRKHTYSNAWVLEGTLKAGSETEEGTEYELFDLRADLNRMSTIETTSGETKERLRGDLEISFPGASIIDLESFRITNSSLTFDSDREGGTIIIQGGED